MDAKTIITLCLVVFIVAGLAFMYIRNKKK